MKVKEKTPFFIAKVQPVARRNNHPIKSQWRSDVNAGELFVSHESSPIKKIYRLPNETEEYEKLADYRIHNSSAHRNCIDEWMHKQCGLTCGDKHTDPSGNYSSNPPAICHTGADCNSPDRRVDEGNISQKLYRNIRLNRILPDTGDRQRRSLLPDCISRGPGCGIHKKA